MNKVDRVKAAIATMTNQPKATEPQVGYITSLIEERHVPEDMAVVLEAVDHDLAQLPMPLASRLIDQLNACPKKIYRVLPDGSRELCDPNER